MNNSTRKAIITVAVLIALGSIGYYLFANPAINPGTGSSSSSMSQVRSSAVSSVTSSQDESSVSSAAVSSAASSLMAASSTATSGSSSSFEQSTPRETVSRFYLEWATYGGFINNELAATSSFLTERMRTTVDEASDIFCNERQPLNFTTVLLVKGDSEATVQVNERYANNVTVSPMVTVRSEDGAWRIDGVTCPASSSSSSL